MSDKDNEIPVVLTVDTSSLTDLESAASSIPDSIDIEINATDNFSDLPFDDIPEETNTEVNVSETDEGKKAVDGITFLANVKAIEIAMNIAGNVIDFVKDIGAMTVGGFLDVEDAVAKINAQTGGTGIADLGQFIRDIQAADLGDSVDQIADVAIKAQQMNLPLQDAVQAALTFTHTFKDQDPTVVLGPLSDLVRTGLVPNLQSAADLMTVFFQQGGNKGGDALATVQRYSDSWSDMGLDITEALSLVSTLMSGGVDTADSAAKMVQTFDDKLTTASANPDSAEAKMLKMMGIDNPKDHGEAIGAETIDGFVKAFNDLPVEQQDLASQLFFGKGGKINTSAIAGATTQSDMFKDYKDAAALAATEVDNSLRGAIDDFILAVNTSIATLLSSDSIDLPGKIAAIKKGLQDGVAVLSQGGTVGEALEVALNIPGLEDALNTFIGNFERIMGNLEIIFLQVVASIQDITGHGTEAAATRATIASKSKTQLAFDLQLANADEIPAMVSQALSRGLKTGDITTALETGVNESIAKGDFTQGATIIQGAIAGAIADGATPEAANALAFNFTDKLKGGFNNALAAGNIDLLQKMIAIPPNAAVPGLDEAVAGFQKQLSDAFAPKAGGVNAVNPFTSAFAGINTSFTDAFPGMAGGKSGATGGGLLGSLKTDIKDFATDATEKGNIAGLAFDHIATTADTMNTGVATSLDTVQTNMANTTASGQQMDVDLAAAMTGNTVTASFDAVALSAETNFPIVLNWFGQVAAGAMNLDRVASSAIQDLSNKLHDLQFLSAAVAQGVKDALQVGANLPGAGGGGGGNNTTVNNNVNQTNNNQNGAQSTASTYDIAAAIGGG